MTILSKENTAKEANGTASLQDKATEQNSKDNSENKLSREMRQELFELNKQREALYGMLSRLYRVEVDQSLLSDLRMASFPVATGNEDVDTGYRKIAQYLSGNLDEALLDLAKDYVRTFIGHGNNAYSAAYPFESVYTSEKRLMMQAARDEVIALYQVAGMKVDSQWKDPEDHIALELEYMQILCSRIEGVLLQGQDDIALSLINLQREFYFNHLASWIPLMTADMKRLSKTEFYQGLAYLTDGFLKVDGDFLNDIIAA